MKLLHYSRLVHQLHISGLSRFLPQPRNLLPTRVKITSNKNHKAPYRSVTLSFGPQPKANTAQLGAFSLIQSTRRVYVWGF
jgi:hypothetical protein